MYWPTWIGPTVWSFTHAEVPGTGEPRGAVSLSDEHPAAITKQTAVNSRRVRCPISRTVARLPHPGHVISCVVGAELARADRGQWEQRFDVTSGGERYECPFRSPAQLPAPDLRRFARRCSDSPGRYLDLVEGLTTSRPLRGTCPRVSVRVAALYFLSPTRPYRKRRASIRSRKPSWPPHPAAIVVRQASHRSSVT
jgi:hypothetical protein